MPDRPGAQCRGVRRSAQLGRDGFDGGGIVRPRRRARTQISKDMTAIEPGSASARPLSGTEILESHALPEPVPAETRVDVIDADAAVSDLYGAHYRALVRLAVLLVHDTATAEGVVQDAFVAMYAGMHRLRGNGVALSSLRAALDRRSRRRV